MGICGGAMQCDEVVMERNRSKNSQKVLEVRNFCWSDDLYELCSPLLQKDIRLNHSEMQYVLRAIRQRLETKPWDWKGPNKPLKSAVDAGCTDLVFVMLHAGMNPTEADLRGVTALHDAAFLGREDMCSILLDGRAEPNFMDCHRQTPLFFAAKTDVCKMLCDAQADVTGMNSRGQTALHFAGIGGLRDVVDWLSQRSSQETVDRKIAAVQLQSIT